MPQRLHSSHYYNGGIDAIYRHEGKTTAPRADWCELCGKRRPLPIVMPVLNMFKTWKGHHLFGFDYHWHAYCAPCDDLVGCIC